ncbi:MAG: sensor histidine kinase [Candidatus Eiseniibacteriota bacterium]
MIQPTGTASPEAQRQRYEAGRLGLARLRVEGGDSLAKVFQESTELAADTLQVDRVSIWLYADEESRIECKELFERPTREHTRGAHLDRADIPLYFCALEQHRVLPIDDARSDPSTEALTAIYLEPLGIYSMLDAPIFRDGRVVGVVCHEHTGWVRHWTQEDMDFASSVADTVALQYEGADRQEAQAALHAHDAYLAEVQKMEALGRMAAGVAHDFRNLLTVILGHARIILDNPQATESVKDDAGRIRIAADRGVAITRELSAFGKDEPSTTPHAVRVSDVLGKFLDVLRGVAGKRHPITVAAGAAGGWIFINPSQLERVLLNLVVNASDAMPDGGPITLRVSETRVTQGQGAPGVYIVLEVRDAGVGMDEATRRRIFEPFFTTKPAGQGTGLGLAIVYRVVEDAGGFVHAESVPGSGTTIRVYLPRVARPD